MGFMEHLTEIGKAVRYTVKAELPTVSRPLYEVLLTGTPVYESGIFHNEVHRLSKEQSIFSIAAENGLRTAAAAYHWMSELYNKSPFEVSDRFQLNTERAIQNGIFYFEDMYPDSHLFTDAEFLRYMAKPDFLLIHSMNIDYAGHCFGGDSAEYTTAALKADMILSNCMKGWLEDGYAVLVTADHGMTAFHMHNGTTDEERLVPLYIAGADAKECSELIPQLELAPFVCQLLDIPKSEKMIGPVHLQP